MVVLKISSIKVDTLKFFFFFFSKNHRKHNASNSAHFHCSVERDVLKMIKGFIKNSFNVSYPDPKPSDQGAANKKTPYFHS